VNDRDQAFAGVLILLVGIALGALAQVHLDGRDQAADDARRLRQLVEVHDAGRALGRQEGALAAWREWELAHPPQFGFTVPAKAR